MKTFSNFISSLVYLLVIFFIIILFILGGSIVVKYIEHDDLQDTEIRRID